MIDTLTIGLTGDVMLGRTLDSIISQQGYNYPWGNVLPLMKKTDLNIINLETTLTYSQKAEIKVFNFKTSPDKSKSLVNANIGIANLANNHILDFSTEGLLETIATLDKAGIKHVGAGVNSVAASSPTVITKNGIRVGVLGFTDNEKGWKADTRPGINYIDLEDNVEREKILDAIEVLRREVDIIFVSIHWGPNMREKPPSNFIRLAHAMIDRGANVIHGHSAHILQGIECYNSNLILYDTGDFVDDYAIDPDLRNDLSAFFCITINKVGVRHLKIIPVRIFHYQVNQAMGTDYSWIINRIKFLSSAFNTHIDEKGEIEINTALETNKEFEIKTETNKHV